MADGKESDVNIKVSADTSQAEGAVKRLKSAFSSAVDGIRTVTKALGNVGLALRGIQLVADASKQATVEDSQPVRTTIEIEMEEVTYDLVDHPYLATALQPQAQHGRRRPPPAVPRQHPDLIQIYHA